MKWWQVSQLNKVGIVINKKLVEFLRSYPAFQIEEWSPWKKIFT